MKVLILNGSSRNDGATRRAIDEMISVFEEEGIEYEIFFIGNKPIADCMDCGYCRKNHECVFKDDDVNLFVRKAKEAEGFVFASPVYYAHPSGRILSFLDRAFYSSSRSTWAYKVSSSIVNCRRSGNTASFDVLNKYYSITAMYNVGSTYWNNTHGFNKEDVEKDKEGLQTLRNLARSMSYLMKALALSKANGLNPPELEKGAFTSFPDGL